MEKDEKLDNEVIALVKKAQTSYHISTKAMQEDKELLKKMYDDLSSSYDNLTREMLEDVETLEKVLQQSASQSGDHSYADKVLESLQACFDFPSQQWMDVMMKAKRRLLNEAQQISNDCLAMKREEMLKIRKIFSDFMLTTLSEKREPGSAPMSPKPDDTFLGTITAITDPGEFYVVRWREIQERERFFNQIQSTATTFPPIDVVVPGQMYAVLISSDQNWFRAIAGVSCGFFQVEDDPAETLYQCFLVDIGRHERIAKSNIRRLPDELKKWHPFAIKCALNADFKGPTWSLSSIAAFKDWALVSPIEIKVLAKEGELLLVDLFRLEEGNRISVMNSLMKVSRPPPPAPSVVTTEKSSPIKNFKPKFGDLGPKSNLLVKYSSVFITKATSPKDITVQLVDDYYPLYCKMKDELQKEFHSATSQSATFCSSPVIGNPYAAQYGEEWHRVLVDNSCGNVEVFYVDIGHRQRIQPTMMFHNLPDRFMELPAQSVLCTLHGVLPPGGQIFHNYPKEIYDIFPYYEGKPAIAFFESWVEWSKVNPALKLRAYIVLYPNDNNQSLNIQVTQTPMACLRFGYRCEQIDLPEHRNIRKRLAARSSARLQLKTEHVVPPINDSKKRKAVDAAISIPNANKEEEVTIPVTFIGCRTPDSIFFRTPELEREFSSLQNAVSTHFETHEESSVDDEPIHLKVGFVGAVKSQEIWHRVEVIDMVKYPEITVFFIDKGCSLKVLAHRIRRLPEEMKRATRTVLRCALSGICPSSDIEWNPKVTQYLRDRLHKAGKISIGCQKDELIGCDGDAKKDIQVTVYIYDSPSCQVPGSTITSTNLNQELVSLGMASKCDNTLDFPLRIQYPKSWKSRKDLFKFGDTFFATATHFSQKGEIFLKDSRFPSELDRIQIHLNEKYNGTNPKEMDLLCAPGDLCIVKSKANWFRGVVQEVNEKKVTVYCADFGYSKVVDLNDIRLDIALIEKPVQVLKCSLHNLKPPDGAEEWSLADQRAILFEAIKCEFRVCVRKPGTPLIQVTMIYKNASQSFNREMVERKLAECIDVTKTRIRQRID